MWWGVIICLFFMFSFPKFGCFVLGIFAVMLFIDGLTNGYAFSEFILWTIVVGLNLLIAFAIWAKLRKPTGG